MSHGVTIAHCLNQTYTLIVNQNDINRTLMTTKDNFTNLTFALTTLLLGMALSQQFFDASAQRLMQSSTVITLLAVVWRVEKSKFSILTALILPISIVLSALSGYWLDSVGFDNIHLYLLLLFFVITAIKAAKQVLFTGDIDSNKILGAICLYMLLGLIWALLYTILALSIEQSFQGIIKSEYWYEIMPTFVYFSFVTLTTLGYGDISPNVPLGQFLVYFEALVGQFYIAILVASLVSANTSKKQKS